MIRVGDLRVCSATEELFIVGEQLRFISHNCFFVSKHDGSLYFEKHSNGWISEQELVSVGVD